MIPNDVPVGPLLVDTDAFSLVAWQKGRYAEFEALMRGHILALSFATIGELRAGAFKARSANQWTDARVAHLETLIGQYVPIGATDAVTRQFAPIYTRFGEQMKGKGINDIWIAACALSQPQVLPIVTANLADYQLIASEFPLTIIHPDL